jgi:hypothetical protein
MIGACMFVHASTALMHDESNPLWRIPPRMALGSNMTDAGARLSHDRDLMAKLPMLEASLHLTTASEEPHLMIRRGLTQPIPQQLRAQARINASRIHDDTQCDHLGSCAGEQ